MKNKIREIFARLSELMTPGGYVSRNAESVRKIALEYTGNFFERENTSISPGGSISLYKPPHAEDAGTLMIDSHIDTVGMTVSEILPEGFVAFTNVGGIDSRILPSLPVKLFGKGEVLRGVVCSVPPHLMRGKEPKAPKISELYIDTGYPSEYLERVCPVGTPIVYEYNPLIMSCGEGDRITSPYLDDKLCAAAAIAAFSEFTSDEVECGIILSLSANEETNGEGALFAARHTPSAAIVLDVNFASGKGVPDYASATIGKGISISYSAATSRTLTRELDGVLTKNGIPFKRIAEPCDTGTNATRLAPSHLGTPCAVMSVPISYMHTPCECASLRDAESMARGIQVFSKAFLAGDGYADRRFIKRLGEVSDGE